MLASLTSLPTLPPLDLASVSSVILSNREKWLKTRLGKITASKFGGLMAYEKKGAMLTKAGETYAIQLAVEELTSFEPDELNVKHMAWGRDHEMDAIAAFTDETSVAVEATGEDQSLLLHESGFFGCTPDGLIYKDGKLSSGFESKCPNSDTHAKYLEVQDEDSLKVIEKDYYWQIQGSMLAANVSSWVFASYDPRFNNDELKLHYCRIKRVDKDIDHLHSRIILVNEKKEHYKSLYSEIINKKQRIKESARQFRSENA